MAPAGGLAHGNFHPVGTKTAKTRLGTNAKIINRHYHLN